MKMETDTQQETVGRRARAVPAAFGHGQSGLDSSSEKLSESGVFPDPIVCISDLLWDEHWSSEQQLMSRLAKRGRVLYVERTVSVLSFFTGACDTSIGRQFLRFCSGGIRFEGPNLLIFTPPPVLPFRFNRLVNAVNELIRVIAIRRTLRMMRAQAPALWIYAPDAGRIVGKLGERFSLYYCADDWSASDQWWNKAEDIRAREQELAAKVDLIIGTSTKIANKWRDQFGKARMISNGADINSFLRAQNNTLPIPADLASIPEPRIGYIGFVDGRFDTKLYEDLARARPDWSLIVVGPLMKKSVDVEKLRPLRNVYFLGPKTREELPAYLAGFDVCTIPYICNQWSESIFPLKLFEYLGAGRPTVATALPELKPFDQYIHLTRSLEEFERAIESSLSDPLPRASQEFLMMNSWDSKADQLWKILLQGVNSGPRHRAVS
jgi:glycosyltransferase involved in cell wall biosynthesis